MTRYTSAEALQLSREIDRFLARRRLEVVHDLESSEARGGGGGIPRKEIARHVDLLVTLGGDGTLLSVARHPAKGVPVLGIDIGTLGFLTACEPGRWEPVLKDALRGSFQTEERRLLAVSVSEEGQPTRRHRAVNDAVLAKSAIARVATLRVEVEGRVVMRYRGDGLIVGTPTGSTAYNLSAGGPILAPELPALVLTPICPHTLTVRPLVLPDDTTFALAVEENSADVTLTLDGQEEVAVSHATRIRVARSAESVSLVRPAGSTYFDVLAAKLSFGGDRESAAL